VSEPERVEITLPEETLNVAAIATRPPREWAERILDVRRWTEMPRGGHFAAFEEQEVLADDVLEFLGEVA
jgi:pimeloyl-ACP methyl ester carboxylesterase